MPGHETAHRLPRRFCVDSWRSCGPLLPRRQRHGSSLSHDRPPPRPPSGAYRAGVGALSGPLIRVSSGCCCCCCCLSAARPTAFAGASTSRRRWMRSARSSSAPSVRMLFASRPAPPPSLHRGHHSRSPMAQAVRAQAVRAVRRRVMRRRAVRQRAVRRSAPTILPSRALRVHRRPLRRLPRRRRE